MIVKRNSGEAYDLTDVFPDFSCRMLINHPTNSPAAEGSAQ